MAHYGAPTGEEFVAHGVGVQRFAGSWLIDTPDTHEVAPPVRVIQSSALSARLANSPGDACAPGTADAPRG